MKLLELAQYVDTDKVRLLRNCEVVRVELCAGDHHGGLGVHDGGVFSGEVTRIGDNVKIDTFVLTAHGVHITVRAFVASGAILGGNCRIGQDAWVDINTTISNRINIEDDAWVSFEQLSLSQTIREFLTWKHMQRDLWKEAA